MKKYKYKRIYVEITNICNLKCEFCPVTKRKKEHMSLENFKYILEEIKPYTQHIYLHLKGEPLTHPQLGQIMDIAGEKGFKVNITTNGTLIKEKTKDIINKPALRQINFSLHSFDGNDQQGIDKEEYLEDIYEFTRQVKGTKTIVALRLWNLDKEENSGNDEILESIEKEYDLDYKIKNKMVTYNGITIRRRLYLNQDYEFTWPGLEEKKDDGQGFCYGLRDHLGILVDGTVVPCCLDGEGVINLGNILTSDFSAIIEGERAQNIYKGFSGRKAVEELCKRCGFRQKFNK